MKEQEAKRLITVLQMKQFDGVALTSEELRLLKQAQNTFRCILKSKNEFWRRILPKS